MGPDTGGVQTVDATFADILEQVYYHRAFGDHELVTAQPRRNLAHLLKVLNDGRSIALLVGQHRKLQMGPPDVALHADALKEGKGRLQVLLGNVDSALLYGQGAKGQVAQSQRLLKALPLALVQRLSERLAGSRQVLLQPVCISLRGQDIQHQAALSDGGSDLESLFV